MGWSAAAAAGGVVVVWVVVASCRLCGFGGSLVAFWGLFSGGLVVGAALCYTSSCVGWLFLVVFSGGSCVFFFCCVLCSFFFSFVVWWCFFPCGCVRVWVRGGLFGFWYGSFRPGGRLGGGGSCGRSGRRGYLGSVWFWYVGCFCVGIWLGCRPALVSGFLGGSGRGLVGGVLWLLVCSAPSRLVRLFSLAVWPGRLFVLVVWWACVSGSLPGPGPAWCASAVSLRRRRPLALRGAGRGGLACLWWSGRAFSFLFLAGGRRLVFLLARVLCGLSLVGSVVWRPSWPALASGCSMSASWLGFSAVGFSGSRALSPSAAASLAAAAAASGVPVLVGCAAGVDGVVRAAVPTARVFRASAFAWQGLTWSAALALRSAAMVRELAASGPAALLVWPGRACPAGLRPGPAWRSGFGSGSWATAALAAGLGVSVFVFLPAGVQPPAAWGAWSLVGGGALAGAWSLAARPAQAKLLRESAGNDRPVLTMPDRSALAEDATGIVAGAFRLSPATGRGWARPDRTSRMDHGVLSARMRVWQGRQGDHHTGRLYVMATGT